MSKGRVRTVSRSDVNDQNLFTFIRDGWLPIPMSIIPPERTNFLWDTLDFQPYDPSRDYQGKLLANLRSAVYSTISEWGDIDRIDRVGVWLSGGVDSSTLLYLTCEMLGSDKVRAYSVDFSDQNEVERAKLIADQCDVRLLSEEMTAEDSIELTDETVFYQRGPVDTTQVPFISRICNQDGTMRILSAQGLDELQAGYAEHVNASDKEFSAVETDLLWKCQSAWAWVQRMQSIQYVEVKFPFLRRELIAWCRGLARAHKCIGRETKVRLRKELKAESLIPEQNIEAGRIVGTKRPFSPILESWFAGGLEEWSKENLPPNGLSAQLTSKIMQIAENDLWRKWRAATVNSFLRLLDANRFSYESP